MRPYEATAGSVEAVHKKWIDKCCEFLGRRYLSYNTYKKMCKEMIEEFDNIPVLDIQKPRVGVVGEILVKFSPTANNRLVELLEHEGAEAVVPDLMDFMYYCFYNQLYKAENLGTSKKAADISRFGISAIKQLRKPMSEAFEASKHFIAPADIYETARNAEEIVSIGNQTGEGWFLTGEMLELIHTGTPNIVCTQPFGCLPNHVVGKGVIKELRKRHPEANIVAIDYDPGASEVNQLNRIKLMLSTAQKNLDKDTTQIDEDESVKFQQKTTSKPSHKKSAGNTASNDKDMTA
jgi:predicted nucleotide-binding protein (sugar kinase/HSP70/actin superfamily)